MDQIVESGKMCENGDLAGLKYYFDNRIPEYNTSYRDALLFCIACENKHYHIIEIYRITNETHM